MFLWPRALTHCCVRLEALAVDNGRAGLVVLGLGDPHLLEGGQRGQDGTSDPDGVLSLRRSDDLDLHGGRGKGGELLGHALGNAREHGGTTRHDDVGIKIASDVDVALHDGLEGAVVDTGSLLADEGRLEEDLRASEALAADNNNVTVRKLVGLLKSRGLSSGLGLLVEVKSDVGELLLDVTNNFTLSSGGEGVTALGQDLHEVISKITASQVQTNDGVGKSVTLIDRNSVGDTITRVQHAASSTAGSVQGQHGLDVDIHGRHVEGLEHDLGHALTVRLGVQRSLSQQDRVFLRGNAELVVEGVMPDLLHVIPVGNDTVLDGVLEGQDTTLGLGLITDISILLVHTDHDSRVLRSADNGREDSARGIVTGETSLSRRHRIAISDISKYKKEQEDSSTHLAHTGAVINDQSLNILVRHDYWVCGGRTNTAE